MSVEPGPPDGGDDDVPEVSDEDLIDATRAGDLDAYGLLWTRHAAVGTRAARAISSTFDPDDLVSEAFASILSAIRAGNGPRDAFRPYMFATIRNLAATWAKKGRDISLDDLDDVAHPSADDPGALAADRSMLAQAFRTLPPRWRSLLWYLEVEGMKPREIAPLMGMSANAVSALAYRARSGFRKAWLDAHIGNPNVPEECRWVCERLITDHRLPEEERERVAEHLSTCRACRIVAADIEHVSDKLRLILLPIAVGSLAAAAYLTDIPTAASASTIDDPGTVEPTALVARPVARRTPTWSAAAVAVVALAVAATITGGVVWALWNPPTPAPSHSPLAAEPSSSPAPTATPSVTPSPSPSTPPPPPPAPLPAPPAPPAAPPAPAEPAPAPPQPTPTPTKPPTPVDTRSQTPALTPLTPGDICVPDILGGTGTPGSVISIRDELGTLLIEANVDDDGRFTAVLPGDLLRQGMLISATQTTPGKTASRPTAAVGPLVFVAPQIAPVGGAPTAVLVDADEDGELDDAFLEATGVIGASMIVSVDGEPTDRVHTFEEETLTRYVRDISAGDHIITIRYVDPESGRTGIAVPFAFTVSAPPAVDP
ncbi:sigma-70 family RNA polymerase sigma factor [Microbacterium sp. Root180]|uniref:sigma-70 family RNA polymerase sigma factor n=1 Tax=Microbacterium sp. Root180 TaxID=1736483 RepID=UPI0006F46AB9|nr:sigma-70 family RNA polymerase sigma factor [Microbacterium sp. Root180]KRB36961.1 hypothetical protein ASD93_13175 [Microbacterium sp. Root180]